MFSFGNLFARVAALATVGPLVLPIWTALLLFALSCLRDPLLALIFRIGGVTDESLKVNVKRKVDAPLGLFFACLALLPFTFLVVPPLGAILVLVCRALILLLFFHMLVQCLDLGIFSWYLAKRHANVSAVVRFFVLCVLYGVALLLLLDWVFGVSVLPLLATSTVLTAILGLALQDTLKNACAGLNMSIEKSIEEGDWVMLRLSGNEQLVGKVVEIGWRTTKILTLNSNFAIIPNAQFTGYELVNFSKPSHVHARTVDVPVSFKADGQTVAQALTHSARSVDGVLQDPAPDAFPIEMKNTHVVYQLRFWLADIERREMVTGAVFERSWKELQEMGALP